MDLKLLPSFPQKFSPSQVSLYSVITSKATIHLLEKYCQDSADSLLSWTVSKYKTHFTILVSSHFFWFCFLNSYSSLRHFWLRNCIHTIQTNTNHEGILSAFNYMLISHPHCDFQFPQTVGKSSNHIFKYFRNFSSFAWVTADRCICHSIFPKLIVFCIIGKCIQTWLISDVTTPSW